MNQISAKIVAHSKNTFGQEICSIEVVMPRIILAELNTHRMFSRNSASSRAIPFEKMLKMVEENPFVPMAWQKDHKGMQGAEYISNPLAIEIRSKQWLEARNNAINQANLLGKDLEFYGSNSEYSVSKLDSKIEDYEPVTKQMINRLLEPFMYHKVLITATEWENFFALRCPRYVVADVDLKGEVINKQIFRSWRDFVKYQMVEKKCNRDVIEQLENYTPLQRLKLNTGQAEIHMMALAEVMWDALNESTPKELQPGEWHMPYGENIETGKVMEYFDANGFSHMTNEDYQNAFIKISTASNARISYTTVGEEGKPVNYKNDINLHDRLAVSGHWSPMEHCARSMNEEEYYTHINGIVPYVKSDDNKLNEDTGQYGWSGNFKGFVQYRKMFSNENIK